MSSRSYKRGKFSEEEALFRSQSSEGDNRLSTS